MSTEEQWFVIPVNPEPWSVGDLSTGRRNGKVTPRMSPNQNLLAYKNAIQEALEGKTNDLMDGPIKITFYFWRNVASYQVEGRKLSRNRVDATNMQKATEDALQGILFANDREVMDVTSKIIEQGPDVAGCVIINIQTLSEDHMEQILHELPHNVYMELCEITTRHAEGSDGEGVATPW